MTIDGAPAMVGKQKGFVKIIKDQIGHPTVNFHCMIHQEHLSPKICSSELHNVMTTVVKVVNFLVARATLKHSFKLCWRSCTVHTRTFRFIEMSVG